MASKKKSKPATSDTSGMSLADFKAKYKPAAVSSASIGTPCKTYVAKGSGPSYVGAPLQNVKSAGQGFAGSGTPLGTSLAGSNLSKGNVLKTALATSSAASALKAASSFKVVRTVPEAVKFLQRELSSELKSQSTKGMSKAQKQAFGEASSELLPSEFSRLTQFDLRKQISGAMRTNKGPLRIVKKK